MTPSEEFASFLESESVKTTKLFWCRKRSYHILWKNKWVFLRWQKRGPITLKNCTMHYLLSSPRQWSPRGLFQPSLFITKLRNRLNDESINGLTFMHQYYKSVKSVLNNSSNFKITLFSSSKNIFISQPKKICVFPGFFSAIWNLGFKILLRIGNTNQVMYISLYFVCISSVLLLLCSHAVSWCWRSVITNSSSVAVPSSSTHPDG